MRHVLLCKPTFKDTIHSSHLPQLYPVLMLVRVYVPIIQRLYGDGDINLSIIRKTGGVEGRTCELQIGRQVRNMYRKANAPPVGREDIIMIQSCMFDSS